MGRGLRGIFVLLLVVLGIAFLAKYFQDMAVKPQVLIYSQFLNDVQQGMVKSVSITDHEITGDFTDPQKGKFTSYSPSDPHLMTLLLQHNVEVDVKPAQGTPWLWIITEGAPIFLLIIFFYWMMRQAQAGGSQALSFGRSKARLLNENRLKVTFDDVAGVDEAKQELQEVVEFLKYPKRFQALGARIPKGVLLVGPPGSGKTLLGRAIAGEAGVPFFYISGSDFVEMFVGVGAARVRDLFEQAKRSAPCIVFIDEIDAVGRQRGAGVGGGHDEREQTLNQLLVEMDGFDPNMGVIILAATNRPDVLDPAILRPGRFDRQIVVDKPDVVGRKAILSIYARKKTLAPDVDLDLLAKRTPGFSGADLENLLNEAALLAARQNKKAIEMSDCEEAIDRVLMGPAKKSKVMSDKEKMRTAYHEAGHALVGKLIPHADPVRKVTILPRGMALGVTWSAPDEDKYNRTKEELLAQITVAMGGRVAEEIALGEISTGASNDIERATELAKRMVTEFGMSEKLGPLAFGHKNRAVFLGRDLMENRDYSEEVANKIDMEVKLIVESCHGNARQILQENRTTLDRISEALLEYEVIDGNDLDDLIHGRPVTKEKPEEKPASRPSPPEKAEGEVPVQPQFQQRKVVPQEG